MRRLNSTGLALGLLVGVLWLLGGCSTLSLPTLSGHKAPAIHPLQGTWFDGEVLVGYRTEAELNAIVADLGGRVVETLPAIRTAVVGLPAGLDVPQAVARLNRRQPAGLRFAEPNYIRDRIAPHPDVGGFDPTVFGAEAIPLPSQGAAYTDPMRQRQWALDAMQAEGAWAIATGRGVTIGIVDTGFDGTHPDLIGKQVTGFDCLHHQEILPDTDGSQEAYAHGTHVAGIAAATGNNGIGIVGVAPEAQLMSLPIFKAELIEPGNGSGYVGDANVADCILWATVIGPDGVEGSGDEASVLNNSWGGRGYGQTLKEAIEKVVEAGAVFVNSMGNSGHDEVLYPKAYPGVLGVGATDPDDGKVNFSTMGQNISVGAPGQDVISSIPMWIDRPDGVPYGYQYFSGTSMAAPQVSGAIALLQERFPEATPYQLQRILELTADDVEASGYDRRTGWGRINLTRALQTTQLPPDGATVAARVVTQNVGEAGQVGVPFTDVILRQNGMDRYFAQTNAQGDARFVNVVPGSYEVLVAGGDTYLLNAREANRIAQQGRVTAIGGEVVDVPFELNTTLRITVQWSAAEDVDLLVGEPGPGDVLNWVGVNGVVSQWGVFGTDVAPNGEGGVVSYTLSDDHYPYAVYPLALSAERAGGPVEVQVAVEQNGVVNAYGPYMLQPGEVLYSNEWYDWWENFPDPEKGFFERGPGGIWVY